MKEREFEMLMQSVIDGEASRDESARLEAELLRSSERRRQFRHAFLLEQRLTVELAAGHGIGSPVVDVVPVQRILRRQRRRVVVSALSASAAVLVALALVMRMILAPHPPATLELAVAPHTDFSVSPASFDGEATGEELRLEPGSRVTIRQGSMRLDFAAGVSGVVMGPAEFTLRGPLEIAMPRGTARFHVEPEGRGFQVVTPLVEVVDLGTEFGVVADGQQPPQIHVFEGTIRASAQKGVQEVRRIGTGEAVEVSGIGRFAPVKLDAGRFLTEIPEDLPYLHLSFEAGTAGELAVDGTHPAVATTEAGLDPRGGKFVDGRIGRAVSLPGLATPVRTTWMGVQGESPRTIAMWVKVEPGVPWKTQRSLVSWGDRREAYSGMCELLLFTREERQPTTLRLAFNQTYYTGATDLADGTWHHVAAVFRGNQVRPGEKIVTLYVDGKPEEIDAAASRVLEEGSIPYTLTDSDTAKPLLIGSTDRPGKDNGFQGEIDEVYIFEAALDETRIRGLANP